MTLHPGDEWGATVSVPEDLPIALDDAEAVELYQRGHRLIGLAGGDLCTTLGGRGDVRDRVGRPGVACPVDIGAVETPAGRWSFAAHVVLRGPMWTGEGAVVMNAEWVGDFRLAPRAHPGDGLLDATEGRLSVRELFMARKRSRTGDHLPHPALRTRRAATVTIELSRPRALFVDGVEVGRTSRLTASISGSSLNVVV